MSVGDNICVDNRDWSVAEAVGEVGAVTDGEDLANLEA
jgi:hypothetical protein